MSLIQAALNKTQNKISAAKPSLEQVADAERLQTLQQWDRDVEQKIRQQRAKQAVKQVTPSRRLLKHQVLLFTLLAIAGLVYFLQPRAAQTVLPASSFKVVTHQADGFALSGIIWDEKQPMAVINQQIVREGERVKKALVKEIGRNYAVIENSGQNLTLRFKR